MTQKQLASWQSVAENEYENFLFYTRYEANSLDLWFPSGLKNKTIKSEWNDDKTQLEKILQIACLVKIFCYLTYIIIIIASINCDLF